MSLREHLRRLDEAVIRRQLEGAEMNSRDERYEVTIEPRARLRCACGGLFLNPVNYGDRPIRDFTPAASPLPGTIVRCERCNTGIQLPALPGINTICDEENSTCTP